MYEYTCTNHCTYIVFDYKSNSRGLSSKKTESRRIQKVKTFSFCDAKFSIFGKTVEGECATAVSKILGKSYNAINDPINYFRIPLEQNKIFLRVRVKRCQKCF